jgi:hypothetical protein
LDTPDPRAVPDERVEVSGRVRGVSRGFAELTLLDKERKPADQTRRVELREWKDSRRPSCSPRKSCRAPIISTLVRGTAGLKKTFVDEIPVVIRPLKLAAEWVEPDMTAPPGSQAQAYLRVTNEEKTGLAGLRVNVRDRIALTLLGATSSEIGAGQTRESFLPN